MSIPQADSLLNISFLERSLKALEEKLEKLRRML